MTLVRCTSCKQRLQEKPFTIYWGWNNADGSHQSWKAKLCVPCLAAKVVPLQVHEPSDDRLRCPSCGIDTEEDMDPVYGTMYVPRAGREEIEAPFCGACAANYRIWIREGSLRMEDRLEAGARLQTEHTALDTLEALGWVSRRVQHDEPA